MHNDKSEVFELKKKKIFIGTIISLDAIICMVPQTTSKVGNVTEKELSKELRQQYGESTLYQMMLSKALLDKYKVSDEEAKRK